MRSFPALSTILADDTLFLGKDLLPWLMLAIGAALLVANVATVVRPPLVDPRNPSLGRRDRAPLSRAVPLGLLGLAVSVWALATLASHAG
ncbi:MAG: hypothetical protein R2698_03555 [Microthrixaceae bacterium]